MFAPAKKTHRLSWIMIVAARYHLDADSLDDTLKMSPAGCKQSNCVATTPLGDNVVILMAVVLASISHTLQKIT